jgi:hypothetical protein
MKKLIFDSSTLSEEHFQIIYQGFVLGVPEGGMRGLESIRRAFKIVTKLEDISEQVTNEAKEPLFYQTGDALRSLKKLSEGETLVLELEDSELILLNQHLEQHKWPLRALKTRLSTQEFIDKS